MTGTRQKTGIFYGWWIVGAACVMRSLTGGLFFYGFGTYFTPLIEEFQWPRAALAGVFSMARVEGSLLGPIEGFFVDRYGPRKIMVVGSLIMGTGYILLTRVSSLAMFSLVFVGLVALGHSLSSWMPVVVAIVNWFRRKRSLALGIAASGTGLGGLMLPGLAWIITRYGWRDSMTIYGIAIIAIGMPVSLLMRHKPEQYGYLPDGDPDAASGAPRLVQGARSSPRRPSKGPKEPEAIEVDFTPRHALRTRGFWFLAVAFSLRQMVTNGIIIHQIPHLNNSGISLEWAATALGAVALVSITGRLGFGWLGDIFEKRHLMVLCFALVGTGALIFAYLKYWWQVILFVMIYAPGYGGANILQDALRAEYYGRKFIGTIRGLMSLAQLVGTAAGPIFAGWVYDVTGSYRFSFVVFASCSLAGILCLLAARRPRPRVP
jgi:MFS family permease